VADTLAGKPVAVSDPLHLALALQFLQGISHHIPYDFALSAPVRQGRKAIHDRLARLVIVNCELRDRLPATVPAGLQVLLDAGVSAVVQPGGSVRDEEVIAAAQAAGVSMYFTGTRHFFH
jgi:hypothetical protein